MFFAAEVLCFFAAERLRRFEKIVFVVKEDESEDPPHIVLEVRVVEFHRPTFVGRGEAAEHQEPGPFGEEETQRMRFDGFIFHPSCLY